MNALINFLFANLIPIIIVVSVILRIYSGMKNAAGSRRRKMTPQVQGREAPEDETTPATDREGEDIQPKFYLAESDPPRQIVPPPASLVPLPEINSLDSASSGSIFKPAAPDPAGSLQVEVSPAFLRRIGALRPMQQALVLSEILGSPRGIKPL
jgi:hypothetical protein